MKEWAFPRKACRLSVMAGILLPACPAYGQTDLRSQFNLAKITCTQQADSGSLTEALNRLAQIEAQNANYPELAALKDSCTAALKSQRGQEDLTFEEAKSAFNHRAFDEAKEKFQWLASRKTVHTTEANGYLLLISKGTGSEAAGANPEDYANLQKAKEYFKTSNLGMAESICKVLVGKGGAIAVEAQALLDQIEARRSNQQEAVRALQLIGRRQGQQAMSILREIQQRDPNYPGLNSLIGQAEQAGGTPAPTQPPGQNLEDGRKLFEQRRYGEALTFFQSAQFSNRGSSEIQDWIQKVEEKLEEQRKQAQLDRLVEDIKALLRRNEFGRAKILVDRAQKLAPDDERIQKLLEQALAGLRQPGTAEDPAAVREALLEDAIRDFYAGRFSHADQLLQQYIGESGKHAALAYFYLGAIVCTDYFLTGEKDQQKQAHAREFFSKGRQADAQFTPPRDWISPKIVEMYQRLTAGS